MLFPKNKHLVFLSLNSHFYAIDELNTTPRKDDKMQIEVTQETIPARISLFISLKSSLALSEKKALCIINQYKQRESYFTKTT